MTWPAAARTAAPPARFARAEALERENGELRGELERLAAAATAPRETGPEVLDLRVDNELLRSMLKQAEAAPARLKERGRPSSA